MNQTISTTKPMNVGRILIGGFVATIVITLMMYFGASMMIGAPMDIAGELAGMIGAPWILGMVMHFVLGTAIFSFAYEFAAPRFIAGNAPIRGMIWGFALWVVAMTMMSPMMGKGLFMGAVPAAIASLVGHLAYGVTLGMIVTIPAKRA